MSTIAVAESLIVPFVVEADFVATHSETHRLPPLTAASVALAAFAAAVALSAAMGQDHSRRHRYDLRLR